MSLPEIYTFESLGIEIILISLPYGAILTKSIVSERFPLKGSDAFDETSTPINKMFCLLGEKGNVSSTLELEEPVIKPNTSEKAFITSER